MSTPHKSPRRTKKKTRSNSMPISLAIESFQLASEARRLAPTTIRNYLTTLLRFQKYITKDYTVDPLVDTITSKDIEAYIRTLDYLSKTTVHTQYIHLSAFFTWCEEKEHLVETSPMSEVSRPKPDKAAINPYTEDDIKAMLTSLEHSKPYKRFGKRGTSANVLGTATRNKAIILLLLDTGIRATELCTLRISHFDLKNRRVHIHGKGSKERIVPCGARTSQAVLRYIATRPETTVGDYLFVQIDGEPFDRNSLRKALIRIGKRAGVMGVGVHRFRHTFAINFLRNGLEHGEANPWALQTILGHEDIKTVKIYLALAQADTDAAHRASSPVENWRL